MLSDAQQAKQDKMVGLGVPEREAELIVRTPGLSSFFDDAIRVCDNSSAVAKWIVNELLRELKARKLEQLPFGGEELGELVDLSARGKVTGSAAKEVFAAMLAGEGKATEIVKRRGLDQIVSTDEVESLINQVLSQNVDKVAAYRDGKVALIGFFVGQVMRSSKGKANPAMVKQILEAKLSA